MRPIQFETETTSMLADVFTPVGIYLRLRDRFPGSILLESTDFHASHNNFSFICIQPIAGIEVTNAKQFEFKYPNEPVIRKKLVGKQAVVVELQQFLQRFQPVSVAEIPVAQGVFGYSSFDAVQFFEEGVAKAYDNVETSQDTSIPLMRYRMYQYVIAINHFKDELYLCENKFSSIDSERDLIVSLIRSKDVPAYPFHASPNVSSNMSDEDYMQMVEKGIAHCHRGDVFQVVLSRRFQQSFTGDEFNVYRALRSINPSPYLFYFDYHDYRLFGSSPESQVIINKKQVTVHPIAGTVKRTGNDEQDELLGKQLLNDAKENAEHTMLVDLARNDLSRHATDVHVASLKQVQYYSHVIHMVSEVKGNLEENANPFEVLASTFPAGTLSGAPKVRAMQIIRQLEPTPRSFYGGAIGVIGLDGDVNHAIIIRSFLSRNNTLYSQAGAGIVAASTPANELQEVENKLNALKKAVDKAQHIS